MEAAAAPAEALQPVSVSSDADEALATDLVATLAAKGAAATHEGAHKVIAAHNPAVAAAEAAAKAQSKKDTEEKKEAYSKRPWSASEDAQLLDTVKKLGVPSVRVDAGSRTEFPQWPDIAKHVAHRTAKQCRERWRHNLDPEIKREPWCEEENQKLLKTYDELGSKWADIARQLPGRTDNACKNQWNKLSGTWKERREESRLAKNKGQPLAESPSSLSAALLGLSALDPSTAGQWNDAALLAAATKGSQRAPKRRRQPSERAKPFNDEALRNSVRFQEPTVLERVQLANALVLAGRGAVRAHGGLHPAARPPRRVQAAQAAQAHPLTPHPDAPHDQGRCGENSTRRASRGHSCGSAGESRREQGRPGPRRAGKARGAADGPVRLPPHGAPGLRPGGVCRAADATG